VLYVAGQLRCLGVAQAGHLAFAQLAQRLGRQAALVERLDYFWLLTWTGMHSAVATSMQRIIR
jgi:hypothetical protein